MQEFFGGRYEQLRQDTRLENVFFYFTVSANLVTVHIYTLQRVVKKFYEVRSHQPLMMNVCSFKSDAAVYSVIL